MNRIRQRLSKSCVDLVKSPFKPSLLHTTTTFGHTEDGPGSKTSQSSNNGANAPQSTQAFPLTGFYQILIDNPQIPSTHGAYYPEMVITLPSTADPELVNSKLAQQDELRSRAKVVFGSRLTGPQRRENINSQAQVIAGIRVPPKPQEPDNCCMSGCVNCVWDLFREDIEEWAEAKTKADQALEKLEARAGTAGWPHKVEDRKAVNNTNKLPESTSMDDDAGRAVRGSSMWEGFNDIPVGIRAFMETEKAIRSKKTTQ